MGYLVLLLSILIVLAVVYSKRKKKQLNKQEPDRLKTQQTKFSWGYIIRTPQEPELSCASIKRICNTPIPINSLSDLPSLPLPGCDLKICRCHLEATTELRSGKDRRMGEVRRTDIRFEDTSDRRSPVNRRKNSAMWNRNSDKR